MWQRFTERSRRIILFAQEEASALGLAGVDTEHLLLGLFREREGIASHILAASGISEEQVRKVVTEQAKPLSQSKRRGEPKLLPKVRHVLERSADEARRMKLNFIGTEHLLLALLREKGGLAATVLNQSGLTIDAARQHVTDYLGVNEHPELRQKSSRLSAFNLETLQSEYKFVLDEKEARIQQLETQVQALNARVEQLAQEVRKLSGDERA